MMVARLLAYVAFGVVMPISITFGCTSFNGCTPALGT